MLEAVHLRATDYRVQPWKNGLGESREIAVDRETPFRWRLSWASFSGSTSFSDYAGYDRCLVLLRGGPLALTHDGKRKKEIGLLSPYSFKGEWATEAKARGPCEDFNVFSLSGKAKAGVYPSRLRSGEDIQLPIAGREHFVFCVEGEIEVRELNTAKEFLLSPRETLRVSRDTTQEFLNIRLRGRSAQSVCLWVVVR